MEINKLIKKILTLLDTHIKCKLKGLKT